MIAKKKPTFEPTITLRTAHDVRKLRCCPYCDRLGDTRHMVEAMGQLVHGGCAVQIIGVKGILAMPREEQNKLTLGEIGMKAMRALVAAR